MAHDPTTRRDFLRAAALSTGALVVSRLALARAPGQGRLVVVLLRGALDGLSAVPPVGDVDYARLRGELALGAPGTPGGALALTPDFGLHPSLSFLHGAWGARELAVFHAVATPYRERSHFDAQDILETGGERAHQFPSGWLNRALASLPRPARGELGVALGNTVPLVLRGGAPVASWAPSALPEVDGDTLQRVMDLYAEDPVLGKRLADALATDALAEASGMDGAPSGKGGGQARQLREAVRTAAAFLSREDGPRVAVLETRGWDTHANQGEAEGQLAQRLKVLDQALSELRTGLAETWGRTAVLLVTEFGRTAAANGTRGTDHGTGAAAFLVGGAVNGGRVVADWPGLSPGALYQGRDVRPTLDLRSLFKGVLAEHLRVPRAALEGEVFPASAAAPALRDVVRG